MSHVTREQAKSLIGRHVYAKRRDGSVVYGRLVRVNGQELVLEPPEGKVGTKAILPLALFDLLAIGTAPFGFGGGFFSPFGFGGWWW